MHPFPVSDVFVILALIALNGVFAMSELAIVSARKPKLEALARAGKRGARTAIELGSDPGRFLSTVQVGITLIGILAGAYSGASLGEPVSERLVVLGVPSDIAQEFGFTLVVIVTTYFSVIIGELVPKQFALRSPEPIAVIMAIPMLWLARVTAPVGWVLNASSGLIFRLLRMNRESENRVTAEELHLMVAEASRSGVIEESERAIISGVVRLADRPVREIMTSRTRVAWIDADADEEAIRARLLETQHTRLPVAEGSIDTIIGVVQSRDIVAALFEGRPLHLRTLMRPASVVPDQIDAMDALGTLRRSEVPMALVHDEYGHFEGIVTPADLLIAIAGAFASDAESEEGRMLVQREDGSWLVSGATPADVLAEQLCITLPEDRDYATTAGLALSVLRRLPHEGELFSFGGWRFEIVDMDGRKIDKLIASEAVGANG